MTERATRHRSGSAATSDLAGQLNHLFSPWNRSDAPGLCVGVKQDDELLYRQGFGLASIEAGQVMTPSTLIRIASLSKQFTAMLALTLAADGLLDLDRSIDTYIPELSGPASEATPRHLLQHRSGLRCHIDIGYLSHGSAVPPAGYALQLANRLQHRNFASGEAMMYNNLGYHLLSIALERVSGCGFADMLRSRIFAPLAMHDTISIPSDFDIRPGNAALHLAADDGRWKRGIFPSREILGEGGIASTIDDMLRWTATLHARSFWPKSLWEEFLGHPAYPDGALGRYCLGIVEEHHRGLRVIHHAGGVAGGSSQLLLVPETGLQIVMLANGAPGADLRALAFQVAEMVLAATGTKIFEKAQRSAIEANFVGDWWSPATGMLYSVRQLEAGPHLFICGTARALPLTLLETGSWCAHSTTLSDIILSQAGTDQLAIEFGGKVDLHTRLAGDIFPIELARRLATTNFFSKEADCKARFNLCETAKSLRADFSDGFGTSSVSLEFLSDRVAKLTPLRSDDQGWSIATFSGIGEEQFSFELNSPRTRHLRFAAVNPVREPASGVGSELVLEASQKSWRLNEPFGVSRGTQITTETIYVTLSDRAGRIGRGEACGIPYAGETPATMLDQIERLRSSLERGVTRDQLRHMLPPGGARCALDAALWDLEAKQTGVGAFDRAGIADARSLVTAYTIGIRTAEEYEVAAARHAAYPLLKIKVDKNDPVAAIEAVRRGAPNADLIVDPNQAWSAEELKAFAPAMHDLGVVLLEQPIAVGAEAGLDGYRCPVALCADELINEASDLVKAIGRFDVINIKLDKTGGLTSALELAEAARSQGFELMVGCMIGSSLSMAPAFVLAQQCRFVDLDGPLLQLDDWPNGLSYCDGTVCPPSRSFWG